VIRLERVSLPDGLRALAYRDPHGNLVIYVSAGLDASRQRAVVLAAIRATRRTGWRGALPPAGVALVLSAATTLLRQAGRALRFRPAAWGAAATATVVGTATAAVFVTAVPHHRAPAAGGRAQRPSAVAPAPGRPAPAHGGHRARTGLTGSDGAPGAEQPATTGKPRPAPAPASGPLPSAAPSPSPSPAPAQPSPSPSPTGSGGICVTLLGIGVCLPPAQVSVPVTG